MKTILKLVFLFLVTSNAMANQKFDDLIKKSDELHLNLKQCGLCPEKRNELESFNADKLNPAIILIRKQIQKKPSLKSSKQIIEIAIANKDSASEFYSDALADVFLSNQKTYKKLVNNLKDNSEKQFILQQTEWGLNNNSKISKNKLNRSLKYIQSIKGSIQ